MSDDKLRTPAWLLTGITGSMSGTLELAAGSLAFVTVEQGHQKQLFKTPLSKVSDVSFPWYYLDGGVKFSIGADHYRISFVEPGDYGDIVAGRSAGKAWKKVFAAAKII